MKERYVKTFLALALIVASMSSASAQERTAAGALDTQMTWTALASKIGSVEAKITGVDTRVTQAVVCGRQSKFYAPAAPGADSAGCLSIDLSVVTKLQNDLNTANNNVNTLNSKVASIINCNSQGKLWNGGGCINTPSPSKFTSVVQAIGPTGNDTTSVTVECPGDTIRVACFGSREPSMVDTCSEQDCGLIGSGPVGDRGCRTTIDGGTGTRPTVWATCMKAD